MRLSFLILFAFHFCILTNPIWMICLLMVNKVIYLNYDRHFLTGDRANLVTINHSSHSYLHLDLIHSVPYSTLLFPVQYLFPCLFPRLHNATIVFGICCFSNGLPALTHSDITTATNHTDLIL